MTELKPVVELIDVSVVEALRRKSPAERLARAFDMWDFARDMLTSVLQQEHPDWLPEQIQQEIFRRVRGVRAPLKETSV